MQQQKSFLSRIVPTLLILAPFALIFRLFIYWQEVDPATGFFKETGLYAAVFNGVAFLVFFFCLICAFLKFKNSPWQWEETAKEKEEPVNPKTLDLIFVSTEETSVNPAPESPEIQALSWKGSLSAFGALLPGFAFLAYFALAMTDEAVFQGQLFFHGFSALCGFALIFQAYLNPVRRSVFCALASFLPAIWFAWRLVLEYQDIARFPNKSMYVGQFLFLIAAVFFFSFRSQLFFGEKALNRPYAFGFSALAAVFFGISARLASPIAAMGGKLTFDLTDASFLIIDLAVTLSALIQLRSFLKEK